MTTWPPASTPWTWKTDLAMSKPIVVIVCMARSSESWEPLTAPISMAPMCRWRSRPQHQHATKGILALNERGRQLRRLLGVDLTTSGNAVRSHSPRPSIGHGKLGSAGRAAVRTPNPMVAGGHPLCTESRNVPMSLRRHYRRTKRTRRDRIKQKPARKGGKHRGGASWRRFNPRRLWRRLSRA